MLFTAKSFDEIDKRTVLDLGCGCGVLSVAAILCGARRVQCTKSRLGTRLPRCHASSFCLGIDVDAAALATARQNLEEADIENQVEFLLADVAQLNNASPLLDRLKS